MYLPSIRGRYVSKRPLFCNRPLNTSLATFLHVRNVAHELDQVVVHDVAGEVVQAASAVCELGQSYGGEKEQGGGQQSGYGKMIHDGLSEFQNWTETNLSIVLSTLVFMHR